MSKIPDRPETEPITGFLAFIVHAWTKSGQIRLAGRLKNGESFAAILPAGPTAALVAAKDAEQGREILAKHNLSPAEFTAAIHPISSHPINYFPTESFSGIQLMAIPLKTEQWHRASGLLGAAGIQVFGDAPRPAEDLLTRCGIRGLARLKGTTTQGKRVNQVFIDPELSNGEGPIINLTWLAIDIETSREGAVRAVSLVMRQTAGQTLAAQANPNDSFSIDEILFRGPASTNPAVHSFASEAGLLQAFLDRIQAIDPDVITGWNVIDFDLDVLATRCAASGIPFLLGRSDEIAHIEKRPGLRTRSFIPGRQAIDAMQLVRGSGTRFEDQTLDTVASGLLGIGKTVHARGEDKMQELDRLYLQEPDAFCQYCLEDSRLVIRILEKTGLHSLTQNRAALTGISLDLAWTSIPAFERIYALELWQRGILPPEKAEPRGVSGASGGMVLNPKAGLFSNVLVLDFRSLYPSIMRSFGIDPLSFERSRVNPQDDDIVAPNEARFRRNFGILPALIGNYFEERSRAQANGDETGAFVYKILMNSFYGVLGSNGCRYGRTELAGAITSFGRFWLEYSRDFFEAEGYRVLYGDTDSVFVATGLDNPGGHGIAELSTLGEGLAKALNQKIALDIQQRFKVDSYLAIRSEKVYGRFLIPRMRSPTRTNSEIDSERGRAKGYAGLLLDPDGSSRVEVKGMEAARSDSTALARRFQMELLALVFADRPASEIKHYLDTVAGDLRSGRLDPELVYRKQLRRNASAYEYSETPPVRAARILGWTKRRGTIEYLMTTAGAEPLGHISHAIDYEHYIGHQLLPIWDSIANAAGLAASGRFSRQAEFDW